MSCQTCAPLEAELQRRREWVFGLAGSLGQSRMESRAPEAFIEEAIQQFRHHDAEDNATQFQLADELAKANDRIVILERDREALRREAERLVRENDRLLSEYGAQDVLTDCRAMLLAVGLGVSGGNTLWSLVRQAAERLANAATDAAPRPITPEVRESVVIYLHGMLCSSLQECCVTNHSTDTRRNYETSADRIIELLNSR